jgi:hypothetical protein
MKMIEKWRDIFEGGSASTARSDIETIAGNQVYLKPWTGPWEKREFPDNTRYREHVRTFCRMQGAEDGEGTQLWGIPEDWMIVTTAAGVGAHLGPARQAWHLLTPTEMGVPVPFVLLDLVNAVEPLPKLRDGQGRMQMLFWSYWNGLLKAGNYVLITAEGLASGGQQSHALVQVDDLLAALPHRGQKEYADFLASVHKQLVSGQV